MAELYEQPKLYANRPAGVTPISGDPDLDKVLAELPPEEREMAMQKITAPPTGEEIAQAMQERNANGELFNMTLDQYRLYKAYQKNKEVDIISTFGQAAGGIYDEITKAGESIVNDPANAVAKLTPSLIEAFAQGTRNLYGMAAQSVDPSSVMFRMKNALAANGSDEEAEYRQFMEAQQFNVHSMNLMSGKETLVMDKDVINPEMTQVMSYVADPTLFIPFGGIAMKGARLVGMGEGLAKASARASMIRNKVLGGTLKWGVGAPIEFMGSAVRNTIDYGLERGSQAFEFATGMPAAEARATAQMYGLQSTSAALSGQTIPLPIVGNIAGAMVGSTTARGVGEALVTLGDQIYKQSKHGRGVLSYAGQALRDTEKSGVVLSNHAKGLLKVIDMADPLFVYSADIAEGAGTGMVIGGGLGYLAGGEEGMASGAGAGFALGAVGAGLGSVTADVTNNRLYDRIAIQRKMVIEGLRGIDDVKASALEAFAKVGEMNAERTGNRRLQAEIDGMIAGIDIMTPNSKFNIRTEAEHTAWLKSLKIDPKTGRLEEASAILPQFGTDRKQRASALSFLSMVSDNFSGLPENLKQHIDALPADHAMKKHWARLSDDVKKVVMDEVKQNANIEYRKQFGGKKANEFYGDINYAEAHTARINSLFDSGNPTQARERINMLLKEETKGGKLTKRGELLKEKLATEGYFDKDGNMRPSRLKDVEITEDVYKNVAGFVIRRDSTGQVEINLNLSQMGRDTAVHELFHAIMLESPMKDEFIDRLSTKLLGKFDANGKRIEGASVDTNQVKKFFQRYIDSLHRNNPTERANETKRLERAIEEYEQRGDQNKVNRTTSTTLEDLVEEFGAFYFPKFIQDKPVDYLFRGGELGAMREMFQSVKFGWLDFWRDKIGTRNPELNFDAVQGYKISQAFGKDGQPRYKNKALDLFMQDFVRATAMANRNGQFDITRLSNDAQKTFIKNNGIRGYGTIDKDGKVVRLNRRTALKEEMRVGKEIYKIVAGIDPKYRQGLTIDGEGNFSGRISPELAEELVKSGHVDRAWVDKLLRAYDIVDGKGSNVIEFGYLGRTAQIGDYAWPRLVGSDVPFKNRKAILLDVDFKIGKDGRMTALYHTLDHAVIEGRANTLWSDPAVRQLWDGDRGSMEADFFRYLSNASLPSDHPDRVSSAKLLEDGTGKGAMRRNALHQMLGMAKLDGDVYINKPIAEIPFGIRHSVTTFNVDGVSGLRVREGARYDYNHRNAFRDLSRNFMMSEMASEETPNGKILKHGTGYKITKMAGSNRFIVFDVDGKELGRFDTLADAGRAAQKDYNTKFDAKVEGKDVPVPRTEIPPSRQAYIDKKFDLKNNTEFIDSIKSALTQKKYKASRHIQDVIDNAAQRLEKEGLSDSFIKVYSGLEFDYKGNNRVLAEHIANEKSRLGREYDNLYPMEIKSALHGRLAQIFQDYPNLTAQGLLKKLDIYGSQGYRYLQEAREIGLVDLLESKIKPRIEIYRKMDAQGNPTGEVVTREIPFERRHTGEVVGGTQPILDMQEILDFAKSKEIKVTIEEGAREVNRMNTEQLTLGGDKSNYKETAVRINPEYAHGIRGHYGENTVVHFRTTERLDAEGNRVLFIEEVQANNTDSKKSEYITPEQVRVSKELAKRVVANRYADELEKRELKLTKIENEVEGLSAYASGRNPDFSNRLRVEKVERQKNAFNLILRNYIDLYKQNNSEYIRNIETATGTPDAPYGSKSFATDTRQHWLNTKQIVESGLFVKELEKHFLTSTNPAEIWRTLLEFKDKDLLLQSEKRNRTRANLPTLDNTLQEKVYQVLESVSNGSSIILNSLADLVYFIRINNQDGINDVIDRIGRKLPYMDESIGRSKYLIHKETVGRETLIEGLKDLANKDKTAQKYADAKIELDKYHNLVISDINSIGDFSHINHGVGRIESVHSDRLREYVSLANTSIDKFNTQGKEPVFPLTSAKDWTLTALKGIIRQAIRDGHDTITLTHPDDSPTVSHMAKDARHGLYGKIIPDTWGSWLRKYGIEIGQQNKLRDATLDTYRKNIVEIQNKIPEANQKVMDRFQQVMSGEDPANIKTLSELLSTPAHELNREKNEVMQIASNRINDVKLRELVKEVVSLKLAEQTEMMRFNEMNGKTIRETGRASFSNVSAEAIDRGMTFKLNDAIKRDFLDGKIKTHAMPEEGESSYIGGRTYNQNGKKWKSGFIGLWAEENPDRLKGKNIQFFKKADGSYRIRMQDNSSGQTRDVGHITASISQNIATLSSNIDPAFRGNKLSYALYSEMAERLRAMGVERVEGQIVNKDGVPIKIREAIIGDTRDYFSGRLISQAEGARRIREKQKMVGSMGGVDVYNELYQNARYQPTELPKERGTSEIKKGYTRVYHQTTAENIESIMKQGLLVSKSRPTSESRGVSVSETPFYGNNPNLVTIELQVPTEKLRQANGSALLEDVPVSDIIAVHEDWHEKARYIEKNKASLKEVLNGDLDFMLGDGSPEAKAIEYIKNKYSKDNARYQPSEAEKAPVKWIKGRFYTEGYNSEVIWMTPERFLKLASPLGDRVNDEASRARIDAIKRTLQREGSDMDMPYFQIMRNEDGELQVNQHEGRHRAIALLELYGDKKIPVELAMTEGLKLDNIGDRDWDYSGRRAKLKPESERKKGTVSKEFKALEDTPLLNQLGTGRYQPAEGGKTYTDKQFNEEFIGKFASENPEIANKFFLRIKENDGGTMEDWDYKMVIYDKDTKKAVARTKWQMFENDDGIFEDAAADVEILNDAYKGMKLSHLMQSERLERSRFLGAEKVRSQITNEDGIPIKNYAKTIGADKGEITSSFADRFNEDGSTKYIPATMENFKQEMDLSKAHADGTWKPTVYYRANLDPNAWYQPSEKIGTQSSNVKLLLEGMRSGRILRTSSYKGLGLEDSLLIAHTPDTAKIGQVTVGDKALADLQGGIFYAIANGNKIWASNFAGEGETNILVKFANRALKKNEGNKTYIMLVKADNSKIFASVDGARGVSSIFKHLNDSGVMSDLKYVKALKDSAKKHLNLTGLDGLGKDELFSKIDDAILNSEANKISFERRAKFSRSIATLLKDSGAFDSERSKKALAESFNSGFERGFSKKEMERVFGNLMAEDIIKDVPIGHVYGAIEIVSPLVEIKESNHRGYNASIVQESGEPARLIMFDKTAHATEVLNKKSGERILKKDPTRHLKDSEGNYVHETDETGELVLTKKGKPKRIVEYKGEGSYISYTGGNIPYQEVRGKKNMPFQPAEGWRDWQSERTSVGSVIKNTAGYLIMVQGGKFKVYNPAKAMIGIYDNEDQAKRRVQKDEPRQ